MGTCDIAILWAPFLDSFNVPGDGMVFYCHNSGGPNYVLHHSSTNSCLTHISHYNDIFPSTLCDS